MVSCFFIFNEWAARNSYECSSFSMRDHKRKNLNTSVSVKGSTNEIALRRYKAQYPRGRSYP